MRAVALAAPASGVDSPAALVHAERVAESTTPPNDGPQVLALGGGQILLRGAAVTDCWCAVSSTIRNAQRRDGLNPSRAADRARVGPRKESPTCGRF
jgi:hypothetical protein